jgi:hypothetical protein
MSALARFAHPKVIGSRISWSKLIGGGPAEPSTGGAEVARASGVTGRREAGWPGGRWERTNSGRTPAATGHPIPDAKCVFGPARVSPIAHLAHRSWTRAACFVRSGRRRKIRRPGRLAAPRSPHREAPPARFELAHPAPEADALSPELWGLTNAERLPVPVGARDTRSGHAGTRSAAYASSPERRYPHPV